MFTHFMKVIKNNLNRYLFTQKPSTSEASNELTKAHWYEERFNHCLSENADANFCDKNDARNAIWFYLRAALRGDKEAQYHLGLSYLNGELGLDRNYSNAEKWLDQAAHQGHSEAKTVLEKTLSHFVIS